MIRQTLCEMKPLGDETPGSVNLFGKPTFPGIVYCADNVDGFAALSLRARGLSLKGRQTLIFHASERNTESDAVSSATAVARELGFFVCRDPKELKQSEVGELSRAMVAALERAGVAKHRIAVMPALHE